MPRKKRASRVDIAGPAAGGSGWRCPSGRRPSPAPRRRTGRPGRSPAACAPLCAPRRAQIAQVLAHPVDGEAEVELVPRPSSSRGCPSARTARRPWRSRRDARRVEPGALGEVDALRQPLHQAGDADLVDHLGQLARARPGPSAAWPWRRRRCTGFGPARRRPRRRRTITVSCAVLGAGLAAGDRRVDESRRPLAARPRAISRATAPRRSCGRPARARRHAGKRAVRAERRPRARRRRCRRTQHDSAPGPPRPAWRRWRRRTPPPTSPPAAPCG